MKQKILIAGGSGLLGKRLTQLLLKKGHEVVWLSRSDDLQADIKKYAWNPQMHTIDLRAFDGVDTVINLAGAGIAEKRWTPARKKELIDSRVQSTYTLYNFLKNNTHQVTTYVSASAVGYYGDTADALITEEHEVAMDFMGTCCKQWEQAADTIAGLGIRTVKLRIGVVLAADGGALVQLAAPIKWGLAAALGSGKQWMSWIHISDLCKLFLKVVEQTDYKGVYNAASPQPETNYAVTKVIANHLNKPFFLPAVPVWALQIMLGEMSKVVLNSNRCSVQRVQKMGFEFEFPDIKAAIADIL